VKRIRLISLPIFAAAVARVVVGAILTADAGRGG
jgi:hypothetical protein